MSGDSGGKTVQSNEPWPGVQPYLNLGYERALQLLSSGGPQYFPNSTVTPFSPQKEQAFAQIEQRALQGNPLLLNAQKYMNDTMGGANGINPNTGYIRDVSTGGITSPVRNQLNATVNGAYLNNNPWLAQTYRNAAEEMSRGYLNSAIPGMNATFSLGGRTGGQAHHQALNDLNYELAGGLRKMGTDIYGQDYANERNRQLQAAQTLGGFDINEQQMALQAQQGNQQADIQKFISDLEAQRFNASQKQQAAQLAPELAKADYYDMDRLANVGQQIEDQGQKVLNDQIARFNHYQNLPDAMLDQYLARLGAMNPGSTSTTSESGSGMNTADWVATAAAAAKLFSTFA